MRNKLILAVDPGQYESGFVVMREDLSVLDKGIIDNLDLMTYSDRINFDVAAIEMVASYGMPVGKSTFDTVFWIGRFVEAFTENGFDVVLQTRKNICATVSHRGAKDGVIAQAMRDLYPASGGGKTPEVGTKKKPGPLYGFKSHIYQALAVGVAYTQGCPRYELPGGAV